MSRNKSNRQHNHPPPQTKQAEGQKESTNRHVYIEPGVQIDVVQDLKNQHQTERTEDKASHKRQLFWTKVAAGLVLAYTFIMAWQLKVAKDTFKETVRPYIGVNTFQLAYFGEDKILKERATKDTNAFAFKVEVKNFGPVPGGDFVGDWKGFFNGTEISGTKIPDAPAILFPSQVVYFSHTVFEPDYAALMNGQKTLTVEITVKYSGPSGPYKYCASHQYAPDMNAFVNLGACRK